MLKCSCVELILITAHQQKGEIGTTRTVLLHGDKNGTTYLLDCSRSQLGEHSTPGKYKGRASSKRQGKIVTLAHNSHSPS